jgi:hypothetical protein
VFRFTLFLWIREPLAYKLWLDAQESSWSKNRAVPCLQRGLSETLDDNLPMLLASRFSISPLKRRASTTSLGCTGERELHTAWRCSVPDTTCRHWTGMKITGSLWKPSAFGRFYCKNINVTGDCHCSHSLSHFSVQMDWAHADQPELFVVVVLFCFLCSIQRIISCILLDIIVIHELPLFYV